MSLRLNLCTKQDNVTDEKNIVTDGLVTDTALLKKYIVNM